MENFKKNKVFNLFNEYKKYFLGSYKIKTENNENINFEMDAGTFSHLLGLQYATKDRKNVSELRKRIIKYKLNDNHIYKLVNYYNGRKKVNLVQNRINNLDYVLKNLDKAYIVNSNNSEKSNIKSNNFILQLKDNKILEIGLVNKYDEEYYLETFLIRNNDKNIDYSKKNKIIGIYKENENCELKPFSFDENKQKILDTFPKYDYLKCIQIYENYEREKTSTKKWNIKKDKDLER